MSEEMQSGGKIPVSERTAYRTYRDKAGRTNAGVLVANYPVTSTIEHKIFPPHNGFIAANNFVTYSLNEVPVLRRCCQIMMSPDKSEATISTWEEFFADSTGRGDNRQTVTITKEQFEILEQLWK